MSGVRASGLDYNGVLQGLKITLVFGSCELKVALVFTASSYSCELSAYTDIVAISIKHCICGALWLSYMGARQEHAKIRTCVVETRIQGKRGS